jgi:hypothetical protein
MKNSFGAIALLALSLSIISGCDNAAASPGKGSEVEASQLEAQGKPLSEGPNQAWRDYWYAGKAELTHYQLQMGRYSEVHPGDAVLIFVAENMHKQKQVKTDNPDDPKVPILKVNFNRKFWTGVYPYSMLTSICQPVDASPVLKVSASCEEWCGHTYMQLNRRGNSYQGELHSYFPDEGDSKLKPQADLLEDQMWTQIRLAPTTLPVGGVEMIPGTHYLRLMHKPAEGVKGEASVTDVNDAVWSDKPAKMWQVTYPSLNRTLQIYYEPEFPWTILGWSEKYPSWSGTELVTTAHRDNSMMLDYWSHNHLADSTLRHQLGL